MVKDKALFSSGVLMRKITKLEKAAVEESFKESQPLEDHKAIKRKLYNARLDLVTYVLEHTLKEE